MPIIVGARFIAPKPLPGDHHASESVRAMPCTLPESCIAQCDAARTSLPQMRPPLDFSRWKRYTAEKGSLCSNARSSATPTLGGEEYTQLWQPQRKHARQRAATAP